MKNLCWTLIGLGALAFLVGTYLAFAGGAVFLLSPQGYWRGAMGLALFAIALRVMEEKK
jgi:uncharacterized membrane protein YiaA